MWTWFELGLLAPVNQWQDEVTAVKQVELLTRYLNDYRFFLQKIGTSHDMIDLESDFFGFARAYGDVNQVPAQVTAANPTDCGNQANTVAGLAHGLIAMARKYAPNTTVGLHLTCWDFPGNVGRCAKDYVTLGATGADFLVGEVEDADAGLNALPENGGHNTFWSAKKWDRQLAYWKRMAEAVGHPIVVWQIPIGNMKQNNTPYHYQDDKVDWLFSHMHRVAKPMSRLCCSAKDRTSRPRPKPTAATCSGRRSPTESRVARGSNNVATSCRPPDSASYDDPEVMRRTTRRRSPTHGGPRSPDPIRSRRHAR